MGTMLRSLGVTARTTLSQVVPGYRAEKVFAIGFNKTGTTSLHKIFQDLGYHSYHGIKWRDPRRPAIYYLYDSFCDGEAGDFRQLDRMFPGSRFILQVRDLDAWLNSRIGHILRLPKGKKRPPEWTAEEKSVQAWVRRRNAFHADVLSYFRGRDNLLLVNYIREPDAAARITAFLGKPPLPKKPHANHNPKAEETLANWDMIAAALNGLNIPRSEWKNDILCPSLGDVEPVGLPADTSEPSEWTRRG